MRYKQPVKLSKADYAAHIAALNVIRVNAEADSRKPLPAQMKENLEPLTMHWSLIGSSSTTVAMSRILFEETGISMSANSLALAMKDWGVPPGNTSGRGAARPQHGGQMAVKLFNTEPR